jgi:branched-subunit amino acid ABC-type transport system permease component
MTPAAMTPFALLPAGATRSHEIEPLRPSLARLVTLAAALFGVDRNSVLLETFALASLLAGLAGYVVTVYYGTFGYAGGIVLGLKALLAAVAGGIGSVPGAFLGGILLGFSESLWSALFPIEFRDLAVFCRSWLLVPVPNGLFGCATAKV